MCTRNRRNLAKRGQKQAGIEIIELAGMTTDTNVRTGSVRHRSSCVIQRQRDISKSVSRFDHGGTLQCIHCNFSEVSKIYHEDAVVSSKTVGNVTVL
jgi:hypothetical protein